MSFHYYKTFTLNDASVQNNTHFKKGLNKFIYRFTDFIKSIKHF